MDARATVAYYARELSRRLRHYARVRRRGYEGRGSLETAAAEILAERAGRGFEAGGHFRGVWPRDLAFAARGLTAAGYADAVRETGERLVGAISDVFYTDFHDRYDAAAPAEGIDTFPAIVVLLAEAGALADHEAAIADLAVRHREKFFDPDARLVSARGSSWWDSAARPREAYDTAVTLAAIDRLEAAGLETPYTGRFDAIRDAWLDALWNGRFFDERRGSSVLACDANVVPLYFGLVDEERARRIVASLSALETPAGLRLRSRPFTWRAVHPFFLLHRDYHYHVWPWNSLAYANGCRRYGLRERADREVERVERVLRRYGTFLEVVTADGEPYAKRGYASASDFTVAAALWTEYRRDRSGCRSADRRPSGRGRVADG